MKVKFRVSTDELAKLCKEMSDFLGSHKYKRGFKRFEICNQVKEEGSFTFDLNVVDGFDHTNKAWTPGAVTEIEIGTQKGTCFKCLTSNIAPTSIKKEINDRE